MREHEMVLIEKFNEVELPFAVPGYMPSTSAYFGIGKSMLDAINAAKRGAREVTFNDLLKEFGHIFMTPESKCLWKYSDRLRLLPDTYGSDKQDGVLAGHYAEHMLEEGPDELTYNPELLLTFYFTFDKAAESFILHFDCSNISNGSELGRFITNIMGEKETDKVLSWRMPYRSPDFLKVVDYMVEKYDSLIYINVDEECKIMISNEEYVDRKDKTHYAKLYPVTGARIMEDMDTMARLQPWLEEGNKIMDRIVYLLMYNKKTDKYFLKRDIRITPKQQSQSVVE